MNCDPQILINELTAIASAVINTRTDTRPDTKGPALDQVEQVVNAGQGVQARGMIADGYRRGLLAEGERAGLVEITYQLPPLGLPAI